MKSRPEFSDAYQWTKSINMPSILLHIQFNIVEYLQLIYRFKSDPSVCIIQEEKSYYDQNQRIFLYSSTMDRTIETLSRYISFVCSNIYTAS